MSFQDKVIAYTGAYTDTASLTQWLTQGAKHIVDLLSDDRVKKFATSVSVDPTAGLDVSGYRLSYVHVNGYDARPIDAGQKAVNQDADSIHFAIARSPVYYFDIGRLYVLPMGTNGTLSAMVYPTVLYSATTIPNFPSELEDAVVLFTAIRVLNSQTKVLALTLSSIPSPVYTDFTAAMNDEDIELAQSYLDKVKVNLQEYSQDIQQIVPQIEANLNTIKELKDLYKEELTKL